MLNKAIKGLSAILIIVYLFSTVDYFIPETIILIILPLLLILARPSFLLTKYSILFFIFIIIYFIDVYFGDDAIMDIKIFGLSFVSIFIWISLWNYYYFRKAEYFYLIRISLYSIIVTVFISSFLVQIFPDIVRFNYQESVIRSAEIRPNILSKIGLMTYGFGHAIPLLFPFFIYIGKKETKKNKMLAYSLTILSLSLLFFSTITTSFLVGLLIVLLSLLFSNKNYFVILFFCSIFLLITILYGNYIILSIIDFASYFSKNIMIDSKITDIKKAIELKDLQYGQIGDRYGLYEISWLTFFKNILFGSHSYKSIGGHAFFVDYLGFYGIIGFLPYLLLMLSHFKANVNNLQHELQPYYYFSLLYFLVLSFVKGAPAREMFAVLFFILPGVALYCNEKYKKIA